MQVVGTSKFKYAIFNRLLALRACSPGVSRFIGNRAGPGTLSLWELFPELVGNEEIINKLFQGQQKYFRLAGLSKMTANPEVGRYYNLKLFALRCSKGEPQQIMVRIENMSKPVVRNQCGIHNDS